MKRDSGTGRRTRLSWIALLVAAGSAAAAGCASGPTAVDVPTVSRDWVTGAAAAALGADGRFMLPGPREPRPLEISEASARAQAVGWARLVGALPTDGSTDWFAPGGSGLERDHGAKISFAQLRDCGRAIYTESAYGPLPPGAPRAMLNGFGAYWIVRLCSPAGDVPVVLAVAATSALVVTEGTLQPSAAAASTGNEFRSAATPLGTSFARAFPLEPEAAVAFVYRRTGRRVSEVPVYVQRVADGRPDPIYPQFGYWRITLEEPVRGVGTASGATYGGRDVAVFWSGGRGADTTLCVALGTQPDTALLMPYTPNGSGPAQLVARLPVRPPYRFEPLRVTPR